MLSRVLNNTLWLYVETGLRMGIGLVVGIWLARFLGPEQYGKLNYAIAFAALFGAFATLGLRSIVVRDIARDKSGANVTLGTAFLLRLGGALVAYAAMLGLGYLLNSDVSALTLIAVIGFSYVFRSSEVMRYWFESQINSRHAVWVESLGLIASASLKIIAILLDSSLVLFAIIILFESILISTGYVAIYFSHSRNVGKWHFNPGRARELMRDAWPLVFSVSLISLNMNIDKIMIGNMIDSSSVGIYSVATQLYNVVNSVLVMLEASFFPVVVQMALADRSQLVPTLSRYYRYIFAGALLLIVGIWLVSGPLIIGLFGPAYSESQGILLIYMLICPFGAFTRAQGQYFKIINRTTVILWRQAMILVFNIIGNLILIPRIGAKGAAVSFVFAFILVLVISLLAGRDQQDLRSLLFDTLRLDRLNPRLDRRMRRPGA